MKQDHLLTPGSMTLITGRRSLTYQRMHALIVELALSDSVRLLIGGGRYDHYGINYALAMATPRYERIMDENIHLSRAETPYQVVELLHQIQADRTPTLALDLLKTFYEEGLPEREVDQLLFETILQLRRISRQATVIVSAHSKPNRPRLLKALENAVERVESI